MTLEEHQRDIFQKLERFVNIQNQRNLIFEKHLSKISQIKIEIPPNITYNIIETKWIALSIIVGSIIIAGAIKL